ncbi:MAG: flagellar basal body-associated FliL family protein [Candidatus Schekmanbacteria bacterium]|nr:flagellar basal body-associated FliL family protein [Candidatus Schekmanbacteria bacterium]
MAIDEEEVVSGKEESGSKKPIFLIVAVLGAAGLFAAGFFGYNMLMKGDDSHAPGAEGQPTAVQAAPAATEDAVTEPAAEGTEAAAGGESAVLPLKPFIVNVGPKADRYLKVTVSLEMNNKLFVEQVVKEADASLAQAKIRDQIIRTLTREQLDTLLSDRGKAKLGGAIMQRVNVVLKADNVKVKAVYFQEFMLQ